MRSRGNPASSGQGQRLFEAGADVADDVVECAPALVVHGNRGHAPGGDQPRHCRVVTQAPDVVDHVGAGPQRRLRHLDTISVDAHGQAGCRNNGPHGRHNAVDLLLAG